MAKEKSGSGKTSSILKKTIKGIAGGVLGLGGLVAKGTIEEIGAAPFIEAGVAGYAALSGRGSNKKTSSDGVSSSEGGGGISGLAGIIKQLVSIENNILSAVQSNSTKLDEINSSVDRQTQEFIGQSRITNDLLKQLNASILGSSSGSKGGAGSEGTDWSSILKGAALGLAAALGGVIGFIKGYFRPLQEIGKFLLDSFKNLPTILEDAFKGLSELFKSSFGEVFEKIFKGMNIVAEDAIKFFKSIFSGEGAAGEIGKIFTSIFNFFKDIGTMAGEWFGSLEKIMTPIKDVFTSVIKTVEGVATTAGEWFGSLGSLEKIMTPIKDVFTSVIKTVEGVATTAGEWLGSLSKMIPFLGDLGKVFTLALKWFEPIGWIVMAIQAAYEGINGAIEGYKQGGIWGAIKGALEGLFDALVGGPLDLIKDAISWISKKLGFEEVSKALDSFSFDDLYKKFLDSVGDITGAIVTNIENFAKGAAKSISNMFSSIWNFITELPKKALGWIGDAMGAVSSTVKGWWDNLVGGNSKGANEDNASVEVSSNRSSTESISEGGSVKKESTQGTVVQKTAFGSTTAGALLTEQGKESGSFTGNDFTVKTVADRDRQGSSTDTSSIRLYGKRTSGGLFGSDTYQIYDNTRNQPVTVSKSDYFDIQGDIDKGDIKSAKAKLDSVVANSQKSTAIPEFDAVGNFIGTVPDEQPNANLNPTPNASSVPFTQQSNQMAMQSAAPQQTPVVINNTNNNMSGGNAAAPQQPPRTSGAVMTAPVSSHIDRALYGDLYGAGIP